MSELRLNLITMQWVVIAPDKDLPKPSPLANTHAIEALPEHDPDCPFCPGNEKGCGKPHLTIGGNGAWRVRVIPNKYPMLKHGPAPERERFGIKIRMDGVGAHEVIVESRRHNTTLGLLSKDDIMENLLAYRERYEELVKHDYVKQVTIFKNHGRSSGSSIVHPHASIVGMPIISSEVRRRMERAINYFEENGRCIFCDCLRQELADGERVITQSENFAAFIPFAALSPYHTWIFPKQHACSYAMLDDHLIADLAGVLKDVLLRLHVGLHNPSYNLCIRSLPSQAGGHSYFHWYISIVPRLLEKAGFEMGSGMYVNPTLPEACAEHLRSIELPQ